MELGGSPAWGPELLIRHQLVGTIDNLANLFAEWERWAADVAESHSTYPSLLYLRSPRALNSWIVSLIAVMDAAALTLAMDPVGAPIEARMCIRMGLTCLRDIARRPGSLRPGPGPTRSSCPGGVRRGLRRLAATGLPTTRPQDEAWAHFRGWRVNYESVAYALAYRLDAPPAKWTGPRRHFRERAHRAGPPDRPPAHLGPARGRGASSRRRAPTRRPAALRPVTEPRWRPVGGAAVGSQVFQCSITAVRAPTQHADRSGPEDQVARRHRVDTEPADGQDPEHVGMGHAGHVARAGPDPGDDPVARIATWCRVSPPGTPSPNRSQPGGPPGWLSSSGPRNRRSPTRPGRG